MSIEIRSINKKFGEFDALKDITLTIPDGQLVALLGPSGCGKTTLLRVIAGLEGADSGSVHFDGAEATTLHVRERHVGFVFQHYALFRHMSVFDNIAFGLQVKPRRDRPTKEAIRAKVFELLRLIQLEHVANHYPAQLSGGQRQRIALARALAVEPKVLLLDEPFGALDAKVRVELRRWLRRLHDEIHVTSVFVTHDQDEALEVCDRIVVMNHGRVEQEGTPDEVYDRPASPFVFDFLGKVNLFHGRVDQGLARMGGMEMAAPEHAGAQDTPALGYVRSHDLEVERVRSGASSVAARVASIHAVGPLVRVELRISDSGDTVEAELGREVARTLELATGENVFVKARKVTVFASDYQI
jgi:sulfate transport system ATP-binding protein